MKTSTYLNKKIKQLLLHSIISCCALLLPHTSNALTSIDYVKQKYEHTIEGLECLFYPAQRPERMVIFFTSAVRNRYTTWSWFWKDTEDWDTTAYLFVRDDTFSWYLGTKERPLVETYCTIINHFAQKMNLSCNQLFAIGGSMGGYAALYYGIILGMRGVYVYRPQITWEHAIKAFEVQLLQEVWVDLDTLVTEHDGPLPLISIHYGEFEADRKGGERLTSALEKRTSFYITHRTSHQWHTEYYPEKELIEKTLAYLEYVASCNVVI